MWSECDQYWPTEQTGAIVSECGKVSVSLLKFTQVSAKFTINRLSVSLMGQKSKEVTLVHFKGWPDCDIPSTRDEVNGFNLMMKYLVNFYNSGFSKAPKALVHCRGGWGRTGTTVMILTRILQRINGTFDSITEKKTLLKLRSQRWNLLETSEQYKFASEV